MKNVVKLQFGKFVDHTEAELRVLFDHNAVPLKQAVEALLKDGPGAHGELIIRYLSQALLENGYFEAFARAKGWWRGGKPKTSERISVRSFLLGRLNPSEETEVLLAGQITKEVVILLIRADRQLRGYQRILWKDSNVGRTFPLTAYFWRDYRELLGLSDRPVLRKDLNRQLAEYGLCLADSDPDWSIRELS